MTTPPQEPTRPSLVRHARELCARERLFPAGSRALVMVSGGQDSLALLELLAARLLGKAGPAEILALHINHHLRGAESDADESLVREHCARLGVGLVVEHRAIEKEEGNVQEGARLARRAATLALADERGCDRIALGHTLDDQVETMLYRMGRYGGLAALRGMPPCDPPWVRPLLGVRRRDTEAFCTERGLVFAVDRGNAYPGYARTGLRERVLPALEEVIPGAAEAAARTAEVAGEVERLMAAMLKETELDLVSAELDVVRLLALPAALRRLLFHAWLQDREGLTASRADVLALDGLLERGGSVGIDLGGGWRAFKEYDLLRLERGSTERAPDRPGAAPPTSAALPEVALPLPGSVEWGGVRICAERVDRFSAPDPRRESYVDAASLEGPLTVRGMRPGDRIRPLGMSGTRKLQDIFVDTHVPAAQRVLVPLVVCGDDIVWVCGFTTAERGRITADTREVVRFSIEPGPAARKFS